MFFHLELSYILAASCSDSPAIVTCAGVIVEGCKARLVSGWMTTLADTEVSVVDMSWLPEWETRPVSTLRGCERRPPCCRVCCRRAGSIWKERVLLNLKMKESMCGGISNNVRIFFSFTLWNKVMIRFPFNAFKHFQSFMYDFVDWQSQQSHTFLACILACITIGCASLSITQKHDCHPATTHPSIAYTISITITQTRFLRSTSQPTLGWLDMDSNIDNNTEFSRGDV